MKMRVAYALCLFFCSFFLSSCQDSTLLPPEKANQPLPLRIQQAMISMNMTKGAPIFIRIFKEESLLEVWKQKKEGTYGLIASYEICKWSGKLGPKFREGDRQAPEGFYSVSPGQMNFASKYYLSFNIGYPNLYDQAQGRTGQHLMVHGSCSSSGCYSMTDKNIAEIYAFGRDAFLEGQRQFQVHAFPFRMTQKNMARYQSDPNYPFWSMLKTGYDFFEMQKIPPKVDVCEGRYIFNATSTPRSPRGLCPVRADHPYTHLQTALQSTHSPDKIIDPLTKIDKTTPSGKPRAPSISGLEEAMVIADWSKRRARGETVSFHPPYFSSDNSLTLAPKHSEKIKIEPTLTAAPARKIPNPYSSKVNPIHQSSYDPYDLSMP